MRFLVLVLILALSLSCGFAKKGIPAKSSDLPVGPDGVLFKQIETFPAIDIGPDVSYDIADSAVGPDIAFPAPALLTIDLAPMAQKVQAQENKTQAMVKKTDGVDKLVREITDIIEEKRRTLSPSAFKKWRKDRANYM